MKTTVAKVLVLGTDDGIQGNFIDAVTPTNLRSSAKVPTRNGPAKILFGRLKVDADLDLQIFAANREKAGAVADSIAAGLVGAVLLMDQSDAEDTGDAGSAWGELSKRGIPTVVAATTERLTEWTIQTALGLPAESPVLNLVTVDKEGVKQALLGVLEAALNKLSRRR